MSILRRLPSARDSSRGQVLHAHGRLHEIAKSIIANQPHAEGTAADLLTRYWQSGRRLTIMLAYWFVVVWRKFSAPSPGGLQ
jgi:hypothetical protein